MQSLKNKILIYVKKTLVTYFTPYNFNYFLVFGVLSAICLGKLILSTFFIVFIVILNIHKVFKSFINCKFENKFFINKFVMFDFLINLDLLTWSNFIVFFIFFLSFFIFVYQNKKNEVLDKYMHVSYFIRIFSSLLITFFITSLNEIKISDLKYTIWAVQILLFIGILVFNHFVNNNPKMSDNHAKFKGHTHLMNYQLLNIYSKPDNFLIYYPKTPSEEMPFIITQSFNNISERFFYVRRGFMNDDSKRHIVYKENQNSNRLAYLYISEKNLKFRDAFVYKVLHILETNFLNKIYKFFYEKF